MEIIDQAFNHTVLLLKPKVFEDDRGYFYESFQLKKFRNLSHSTQDVSFVQDNESKSAKNVLRGLHFQEPPHAQGKLIRVISGSVFDVAVDLRRDSPTFGQAFTAELNEKNKFQMWIPPGFAHGFQTLKEDTIFAYKCTNYYQPESEQGILWCDRDLDINWPLNHPILSEKDRNAMAFEDYRSPF